MGQLILVLGGARSGKSTYAQQLAQELGQDRVLVVATAEARDEEMAQRIARHRQARPAAWRTLEAPRQVGEVLQASAEDARVVLIDCVTLWVSNILLGLGDSPELTRAERVIREEVNTLLHVSQELTATLIIVSNEVGLGLVPETPLGRMYRDVLGEANQALAAHAHRVYFMVAGLAVDVKALARTPGSVPGNDA